MNLILTLNSGSSSLKFSLFETEGEKLEQRLSGNLNGINTCAGKFAVTRQGGSSEAECRLADHRQALSEMMGFLQKEIDQEEVSLVGHRIVHGGRDYTKPELIDSKLIDELRKLSRFAPLHLPPAITTLESALEAFSDAKHIACFDTSFHRTMPKVARMLPLTSEIFEEGVEKYGFHGLSYEFVVGDLRRQFGAELASGKLVVAHLGNGCSMAAIKGGNSVETTMGFSPAGGLVMGTRCGDIDPGLISYFHDEKHFSPKDFVEMANHKSGLLGISGSSSDMRTLLAAEQKDEKAHLALEIYCYHARKHIGALSAVLGGLDALIFTGGIGENAPAIRERICRGLDFMGVSIDHELNGKKHAAEISKKGASVRTFVINTNEELMIARHCLELTRSVPGTG